MTMKTFGGTACRVYVGGQPYIWSVGISIRETHQNLRSEVHGLYDAFENVPNGRIVSVSMDTFVVVDDSITALQGIWPSGNNQQLIEFPDSYLELYQQVSKKVIRKVTGLRGESRMLNAPRAGHVTERLTFVGISLFDESLRSLNAIS